MSNFSFPPPPPPPPKAAPDPAIQYPYPTYGSQHGQSGRGSHHGSHRGSHRGRGRGEYRGDRRGFHSQQAARGGEHQYTTGSSYMSNNVQPGNHMPNYHVPNTNLSSGAHFNGNLQPNGSFPGQSNYANLHANSIPLATQMYQAPASVPKFTPQNGGITSHNSYGAVSRNESQKHNTNQHNYPRPANGLNNHFKTSVAPAIPSFGAPLPLIRPVQAASLLVGSNSADRADDTSKQQGKKRKRKSNQLGLTPLGEEYEESEGEGEVDEEAKFVSRDKPLQVEYKGKISVLGNAIEIKAWIEERKKRWPTNARVDQRLQEDAKRRAELDEARKKAQESRSQLRGEQERQRNARTQHVEMQARGGAKEDPDSQQHSHAKREDEKSRQAREKQLAKVERLRKKLEKSEKKLLNQEELRTPKATSGSRIQEESAAKEKLHDQGSELNEGSGPVPDPNTMREVTQPMDSMMALPGKVLATTEIPGSVSKSIDEDQEKFVRSDSTPIPSTSESSGTSNSDSDSSSDISNSASSASASAPEEQSTKPSGPIRVPPSSFETRKARPCKYFQQGHCKAGANCSFLHNVPKGKARDSSRKDRNETSGGKQRKTLQQRFVEQEQEQENRLALQAIKYLGEQGFFKEFEEAMAS